MAAVTASSALGDKRFSGSHTIVGWAIDLIGKINSYGWNIPVNPITIGILVTWANTESGGYNPNAPGGRNNPLNTTQRGTGWIGQGGQQGNISDFDTYENGIANQAYNLTHGTSFGYDAILSGLQSVNPSSTFSAINASRFGTHFGPDTKISTSDQATLQAAATAQESSAVTDTFSTLISNVPGLGNIFQAATLPAKLAGLFIGVFSNWRFVLEVLAGGAMIIAGLWLIAKDTGAIDAGNRAAQRGAQVASMAAVAA